MGKKAVEIIDLNVEELIATLNAALSEEWLAFYQYWVGARVMVGPMRSVVEDELLKHAKEELEHAEMLVERITQLGGTPVLSPKEWFDHADCEYEAPTDEHVGAILQQNLNGERCAIARYQNLAKMTAGKDYATHQIAMKILADELEHEEEIQNWLADMA